MSEFTEQKVEEREETIENIGPLSNNDNLRPGSSLVTQTNEWDPSVNSFRMGDYFLADRIREGLGNNVALHTGDRTITYSQVHERACRAGNLLRECGIEVENRVLLIQNNCEELVYSYFGTLYIGGVVTMAVPFLENKDLYTYFLNYTRAKVVAIPQSLCTFIKSIWDEGKLSYLRKVLVTECTTDTGIDLQDERFLNFDSCLQKASPDLAFENLTKDDMALWYFTGGTTGLPKGCVHLQHDLPYAAETYGKEIMQLGPSDITATVSPMVGPYAMGSNLLFPFSVGAACVLDNFQPSTPDKVFDLIEKYHPTVISTTPGIIRGMAQHERAITADLSCLRYVTSAGDVLPAATYHLWKEKFGIEILDGIGTSELQHIFISNRLGDVKPGSIGKVVPGYEVFLLDDDGHQVMQGEVGEMVVKGDSNSLCYWNEHQKSKEAFHRDKFITGDMAYQDENGYFYLCGRKKDLKSMFSDKKRNIKISFLRVEEHLLSSPGVKDCSLVDIQQENGEPVYTAYVVLQDEEDENESKKEEILKFLEERVGKESSPTEILFIRSIPRNARDKIERKLLRDILFLLFTKADQNGDGKIDEAEFTAFIGTFVPEAKDKVQFHDYDEGTNDIDFTEFHTLILDLKKKHIQGNIIP